MNDHISKPMAPWECADNCPCRDDNPSEREYRRLVASDNKLSKSSFRVLLRFHLEAALIGVILAWTLINGFWILTHAW